MKKNMDTIQFESRAELQEIMRAIEEYVKQNPKQKENRTLKEFYNLLDVMEMEW
jgi:5-bromo-4-chloroindolyl phosphate hydrolysis protein